MKKITPREIWDKFVEIAVPFYQFLGWLPKEKEMNQGLYNKYEIRKRDGKLVDPEAVYFVLRLDTDPVARAAARTYAKEIRATKPILADELEEILDGADV